MRRVLYGAGPLLALLLAVVTPAGAQMALGEHERFSTRFGEVQVLEGQYEDTLAFNGRAYPELNGWRVRVLGGIGVDGEPQDWLLVERLSGGNGCFSVLSFVRVRADGLLSSPEFGHCAATPMAVRAQEGRIEVDLSHPDITIQMETFGFDGITLTHVPQVVAITAAPAQGGQDVLRWIGAGASAVFDDPSERARFATIMPAEWISEFQSYVLVSNVNERHGDWVIGAGCRPHQCNVSRGVWGLRVSDGAVGAAQLGPNGFEETFGMAQSDPTLRAAIERHRP